jgi:hypothetical protein
MSKNLLKDPGKLEFDEIIFKDDNTSGCAVEIPFSVPEIFGVKGQVKVIGTLDGEPIRTSIAPYGGKHYLGITKAMRAKLGKEAGDVVRVVIELDTEPRVVEIPEDFKNVLKEFPQEEEAFKKLSYTHQREYVTWINDAKKAETRERRIAKAIEMLCNGKRGK